MNTAHALDVIAARLQRSALFALLRQLICCALAFNLLHDMVSSSTVPGWGNGHPTLITTLHAALWSAALALASWVYRPLEKRWESVYFTCYASLVALGATLALYWSQLVAALRPVVMYLANPFAHDPFALPVLLGILAAVMLVAAVWDFYLVPKRRREQLQLALVMETGEQHQLYQMQAIERE